MKNLEDEDLVQEIVKNLSCEDPEKIDNGAQETPYIKEYAVQE